MPRQRKTISGLPGQPATPIAGQEYGMGVAQQRLQEAMPAPVAGAPAAPGPAPATAQGYDAALAAAQQLQGNTGLLVPETNRPQEPITAGLSRGPGPGPEVLNAVRGTPAGDLLRRLSASTGDPSFAQLADRAKA